MLFHTIVLDTRYLTKVYSDINKVGLRTLQFNIKGSNVRFNAIYFNTDIGLSAHLGIPNQVLNHFLTQILIKPPGNANIFKIGFREQWKWRLRDQCWLIGSSGGSLVAISDCKPDVPGSNPAISPTYSGLSILDGLLSGIVLHCTLSSEGWQRRINAKKEPLVH